MVNDVFGGDRSGHISAAGAAGGPTMFQDDIATKAWQALPTFPVRSTPVASTSRTTVPRTTPG